MDKAQLIELLYLQVFPILGTVTPILFAIFLSIIPRSAWVRIMSKFKRGVVIVSLFTDEGYEHSELMKSDLGQGILSGKQYSYIFSPRPITKTVGTGPDKKIIYDIPADEKANFNEAIIHRFFTDTGKPLYLGYPGKSVAVTPEFLKLVQKTHGVKQVTLEKIRKENEELELPKDFKLLTLLDPRVLKLYLTKTLSPSIIEGIKQENERKGQLRRGLTDQIASNIFPLLIIAGIAILVYLILSGNLNLGSLGGLFPSAPQ